MTEYRGRMTDGRRLKSEVGKKEWGQLSEFESRNAEVGIWNAEGKVEV